MQQVFGQRKVKDVKDPKLRSEEPRLQTVVSSPPEDLEGRKKESVSYASPSYYNAPKITPLNLVLICGLLIMSLLTFYLYSQNSQTSATLQQVMLSFDGKKSEFAQLAVGMKRRMEELHLHKEKSHATLQELQEEVDTLQAELTKAKHAVHEEKTKAQRLHRDNEELHKKLQVKSQELKVLEEQASKFEKEMNRLTKAIHTMQGDPPADVDNGDYEALYRKQDEQQRRAKGVHVRTRGGSRRRSSEASPEQTTNAGSEEATATRTAQMAENGQGASD
mmetsp:Transcript_5064/g.11003  ORF Transcript_5064/g.11003 Transcript_5064/m.11003 type:complete len:277 (-) Transcript_5064:2155-2985(-)|eukprot:CAMPEP_0202891820 /NCGR_PEP_ID=MMETSP1392-20130828/1778_1 /ASSEMBLY_ACC=CAM_ASM_000868 /TAXON_ID=225041 /ORGANISM="Chlamydomonas chlamydogama, Strain SAG 11-48b" /LENGTH=276 /DNA_ID=CAMNT_0049575679 /DNA_START=89 /DNA_END=919 /DNA_ORIENTATION=+